MNKKQVRALAIGAVFGSAATISLTNAFPALQHWGTVLDNREMAQTDKAVGALVSDPGYALYLAAVRNDTQAMQKNASPRSFLQALQYAAHPPLNSNAFTGNDVIKNLTSSLAPASDNEYNAAAGDFLNEMLMQGNKAVVESLYRNGTVSRGWFVEDIKRYATQWGKFAANGGEVYSDPLPILMSVVSDQDIEQARKELKSQDREFYPDSRYGLDTLDIPLDKFLRQAYESEYHYEGHDPFRVSAQNVVSSPRP